MLMKIKRESTEVENMYLPEFKTFKKKRSIEKGRLSYFYYFGGIPNFRTPFLGILTSTFLAKFAFRTCCYLKIEKCFENSCRSQ